MQPTDIPGRNARAMLPLLEEIVERDAEIERLRRALMDCNHQTHSMRVWGGLKGWVYHPTQAGRIARISREALDAVPNEQN